MRRLGSWLVIATLGAAPAPKQVLPLGSSIALALAGDETETLIVEVPAGRAARLTLHEERGISGRFVVRDAESATFARLDPTWRVPAAQYLTLLAGNYQVTIEPAFHSSVMRRFSLEASAAHDETEEDRLQHQAEALQGEGEWIASQFEPGYLANALPKFEAARAIWEQAGKGPGLANTLQSIASNQYAQGDMPTARATYQMLLDLWTSEGDQLGMAAARAGIANIENDTGKPKAAIEYSRSALETLRKLGSLRAQGDSLLLLAGAERNLGNNDAARADFDEALKCEIADGNRLMEASVRNTLGVMEFQSGNYAAAEKIYQEVLTIDRENHLSAHYATVLSNLGTLYLDSGDPRQGVRVLEEALPLRKQFGQPGSHAVTLYNLARAHHTLGEYQAALDEVNEALPLFRKRQFVVGEAYALQEEGEVYADLGEPAKAEALLKQALELRRSASDRRGEASTLLRLGRLHESLGQIPKSVEELQASLKIARPAGYAMEQTQALSGLASGMIALKQYREALEPIAEELELSRKSAIPLEEGDALDLQGQALAAMGDVEKARKAFLDATDIRRRLGASSEAQSLLHLARLEGDAGSAATALPYALKSLELVESLRSNVGSHASRMRVASSHRAFYDLAIDLAVRAGQPAEALAIAERGKARSLIDFLAEAGVDLNHRLDPQLTAKEKQVEELLDARYERLLRLLESPHTPAREASARRDVDAAFDSYQQVQSEIRVRSPETAAITQPHMLQVSGIQALLPETGAAFVEFWLGDTGSYAWLVTRTECRTFHLPARAAIEAAALRMHGAISTRDVNRLGEAQERYRKASQELGRMLREPLASLGSWKRWWVVTDGALDLVPLAALSLSDGQMIGARHQIVNLPSASAAAELARLTGARNRPVGEVAVFADPVFRTNDSRMAADASRGAADVEGLGSLPRLYFSRDEAEAISHLAAGKRNWVALDFDATRAAAESGKLADYRIVHFATHGIVNTQRPDFSGIVLTMVNRQGRPLDGFLALHDIYNLKLTADLVVLSGCQTALGESVRSEGIVGLTRGFLHAGSKQVLASLWSVPDRGTAEFISRFYDALLRRGQDAAAALQSAQISMMKDPRWSDPYYWAAFRLEGLPGAMSELAQ
jgi:CHAT domain-containing protein